MFAKSGFTPPRTGVCIGVGVIVVAVVVGGECAIPMAVESVVVIEPESAVGRLGSGGRDMNIVKSSFWEQVP